LGGNLWSSYLCFLRRLHPPDNCRLNPRLHTTTSRLFPPPTSITKNRLSHAKLRKQRHISFVYDFDKWALDSLLLCGFCCFFKRSASPNLFITLPCLSLWEHYRKPTRIERGLMRRTFAEPKLRSPCYLFGYVIMKHQQAYSFLKADAFLVWLVLVSQ